MVEADFLALLERRRTERLAALMKDQPPQFWAAVGNKLESSPDETITMDELMVLLHERDLD